MPQSIGKIGLVGVGAVGGFYGLMLHTGGGRYSFPFAK